MDGEVKKREAERIKQAIEEEAIAARLAAEAEVAAAKARAELLAAQQQELELQQQAKQEPQEELNINAIEQDSKSEPIKTETNPMPTQSLAAPQTEPVEMKAELPKNVHGLFSPVALSGANITPSSPARSNADIQVISEHRASNLSARPGNSNPMPMIPREPSPPPKPDGSECHRSQSAIFTRMWNRGEGNSCSRTDMIFKPGNLQF